MKTINLSKGKQAIVDDEDFDYLSQWKWCVNSAGYAVRGVHHYENGKRKTTLILMHRIINETPDGFYTDHADGNPLNNARSNLRNATKGENQRNMKLRKDSSSGVKGVQKNGKNWMAGIRVGGKRLHLGTYTSKELASQAYNEASLKIYGAFSATNRGL